MKRAGIQVPEVHISGQPIIVVFLVCTNVNGVCLTRFSVSALINVILGRVFWFSNGIMLLYIEHF